MKYTYIMLDRYNFPYLKLELTNTDLNRAADGECEIIRCLRPDSDKLVFDLTSWKYHDGEWVEMKHHSPCQNSIDLIKEDTTFEGWYAPVHHETTARPVQGSYFFEHDKAKLIKKIRDHYSPEVQAKLALEEENAA